MLPRVWTRFALLAAVCAATGCSSTPPASFHTVETAPLLFVGATGDPATPYKWALGAIPFFPGSVLLTRDGDGHVSFGRSTCADSYEQAYLVNLTLPSPGTTCPTN